MTSSDLPLLLLSRGEKEGARAFPFQWLWPETAEKKKKKKPSLFPFPSVAHVFLSDERQLRSKTQTTQTSITGGALLLRNPRHHILNPLESQPSSVVVVHAYLSSPHQIGPLHRGHAMASADPQFLVGAAAYFYGLDPPGTKPRGISARDFASRLRTHSHTSGKTDAQVISRAQELMKAEAYTWWDEGVLQGAFSRFIDLHRIQNDLEYFISEFLDQWARGTTTQEITTQALELEKLRLAPGEPVPLYLKRVQAAAATQDKRLQEMHLERVCAVPAATYVPAAMRQSLAELSGDERVTFTKDELNEYIDLIVASCHSATAQDVLSASTFVRTCHVALRNLPKTYQRQIVAENMFKANFCLKTMDHMITPILHTRENPGQSQRGQGVHAVKFTPEAQSASDAESDEEADVAALRPSAKGKGKGKGKKGGKKNKQGGSKQTGVYCKFCDLSSHDLSVCRQFKKFSDLNQQEQRANRSRRENPSAPRKTKVHATASDESPSNFEALSLSASGNE